MFQRTKQGAVDLIAGNISLSRESAAELARVIGECLDHGQPMAVLDMQKIPLMDSAGLEQLLAGQDEFLKRGGMLKLAAPSPLCRDILVATGVGTKFEIYGDVKSAVGSFLR
jgi:anti-anti-sigma factor